MKKVTVKVPATTANIGPGFDCLGCAFSLYDTLTYEIIDSGLEIIGDSPAYCNEHNLAVRGYKSVTDRLAIPMDGLRITADYRIPMSHGLGSSAAMIVAGAAAANALHGSPFTKDELLEITTPLEGHPDNLAPALFGGLTASLMLGEKPVTVRYALSKNVAFTVLIPDFNLSTSLARSVLPDTVSRGDAIFNISHTAVLLKALELGDGEIISAALDDRLHQPYRSSLIPGYEEIRALALDCGADGFCISGAGPTLLSVSTAPSVPERLERAMERFPTWKVMTLRTDSEGVKAE